MLLGGGQEDEAAKVSNVLGIVGEVRIQFKIEVYIQVVGAHDAKAVCELFLEEDEKSRTVLLPVGPFQVDEHFHASDEQDYSAVFIQSSLQLLLEKRINLHQSDSI